MLQVRVLSVDVNTTRASLTKSRAHCNLELSAAIKDCDGEIVGVGYFSEEAVLVRPNECVRFRTNTAFTIGEQLVLYPLRKRDAPAALSITCDAIVHAGF